MGFPNFPGGSDGNASAYNAGDPGSIPGSGGSPRYSSILAATAPSPPPNKKRLKVGFPEQWILDFCLKKKKKKKKPTLHLLTRTTPWNIEGASLPSGEPGRDRQLYPKSLREGLLGYLE